LDFLLFFISSNFIATLPCPFPLVSSVNFSVDS